MDAIQQQRILVVGGHSRNVGKTALVVDLIRAFPEVEWTAVKITQYGHGVCTRSTGGCDCAPTEHTVALDEEHDRSNHSDTSRFLIAGAARALWLRTKQGRLAEGMPLLRSWIADAENVVLESNSILQLLQPSLYLVILEPRQPDFKSSAQQALDRADAFVMRSPLTVSPWSGISTRLMAGKPEFHQRLGEPLPQALVDFVRRRMFSPLTVPENHR